jgi:hypothetical protein
MLHNTGSIVILTLLILPPAALSEIICSLGSDRSGYDVYVDQRPTVDAMQLVGRVGAALRPLCSPNCLTVEIFRNATAPNAILMVDSGRVKLAYSPQFFTTVYDKYGESGIIAVIAHMLGHALDATAHPAWMKSSWTPELCADAWTGWALAKANLSLTGLRSALATLKTYPSRAHPGWPQRIPALRAGYTQCGGTGARFDAAGGLARK